MRYSTYYEGPRIGFGGKFTTVVKYVILISVGSFLAGTLFELAGSSFWIRAFGLTPYIVKKYFALWQFVTYMFVHGGLWHVLFNMFALWMFGSELESSWGSREFAVYFLVTGGCAGLLYFIFASGLPLPLVSGSPFQVLIGSSGAIFGLLAAYGICFPDRQILFMLLFPIKARYFVLLLAAIEFYLAWQPSSVSNFTHLSGMLIGWIYLKKDWNFSNLPERLADRRRRKRIRLVEDRDEETRLEKNEVDRILDKILKEGLQSLTRRERKILDRASLRGRHK
ncbi:MAG: rhomboid family intramembrane serine protease [Candidatus Glassbacteria bacterium]